MKKLFQGVPATLYIPLAARIYVSRHFPEYFYDEKALSLEKYIPGETIQKHSSEYDYMASAAREHVLDGKVRYFLSKNQKANIVFLGAGLETAYFRLGNHQANFYEVDLPEVIEVRRK